MTLLRYLLSFRTCLDDLDSSVSISGLSLSLRREVLSARLLGTHPRRGRR